MRITIKTLRDNVNYLNRLTGHSNPDAPGFFSLDLAFSGYALRSNALSGGSNDVFQRGYMTARECHDAIVAYSKGFYAASNTTKRCGSEA